ncbi:MAG: hypothetical protein O9294_18665 [Cytophagales bacterium]|jgi:hypothetical protein|nr:hypothetical protein [Cytophagales bacterium]
MLTYNELIELRKKLINGKITQKLAKEIYWNDHKEGQRSWHTNDWKKRRSEVIKDKCEICDSKQTLTLQHLSHPKKYNEYEREVMRKHIQSNRDSNTTVDKFEFTEYITQKYNYVPVPLCPNCKNRYPNKRKRKVPQYRCTECQNEFDEPFYRSIDELIATFYKNEEVVEVRDKCFGLKGKEKNQHNLSSVRYWLEREKIKDKESDVIGKEAFLRFLDDNIKYLSFEDTITACNKCAFSYDMHNMELCPKCKKFYKGIQYQTCIQCLPEERRKVVLEQIEFGKEWRAMHKYLDIE